MNNDTQHSTELLLTRQEVLDLLGPDPRTFDDWLERDWLRWAGSLPSEPPDRDTAMPVFAVLDAWLRAQVETELREHDRTLVVDTLPDEERTQVLQRAALSRAPEKPRHRSLALRRKKKRRDRKAARKRRRRASATLREQSLAVRTPIELEELVELIEPVAVAAAEAAEASLPEPGETSDTNTILTTDLLGAMADALIELHDDVRDVARVVGKAGAPRDVPNEVTQLPGLLHDLRRELDELRSRNEAAPTLATPAPGDAPVSDATVGDPAPSDTDKGDTGADTVGEVAVLGDLRLVLQALQGIHTELADDRSHREELADGFQELVDGFIRLHEAVRQPESSDLTTRIEELGAEIAAVRAAVTAPTEGAAGDTGTPNAATPEVTELTDAVRTLQVEFHEQSSSQGQILAALQQLQEQAGAQPPTPTAAPTEQLDRIEDAVGKLTAERAHGDGGEVTAAVVKLAEDSDRLRSQLDRANARGDAIAEEIHKLAERGERQAEAVAANSAAHVAASSTATPWLAVAIAVLTLSWAVVLFVKTGDAKLPLTGMAAANLVCCLAILIGTSRR